VWLLSVGAQSRQRGIGRLLLEHAISLFAESKVFTSTNTSNMPAQRLMEAAGFERAGLVEHLDEGDPEIFYVRLPDGGQSR